jgi:hypothetical protein
MSHKPMKSMLPVVTLLFAGASHAQQPAGEFTQQAKHEHGAVTLNLAVEGNSLAAELEAPAINVVGFEHEPRTDAERASAAAASAWLSSGAGLLGVPKAARCRRDSVQLQAPTWSKSSKEHDPDHAHDHDHEQQTADAHADYRASIRYTCSNPAALAWVEAWALRKLLEVSALTINIVTTTGQKSVTTVKPDERIALR